MTGSEDKIKRLEEMFKRVHRERGSGVGPPVSFSASVMHVVRSLELKENVYSVWWRALQPSVLIGVLLAVMVLLYGRYETGYIEEELVAYVLASYLDDAGDIIGEGFVLREEEGL